MPLILINREREDHRAGPLRKLAPYGSITVRVNSARWKGLPTKGKLSCGVRFNRSNKHKGIQLTQGPSVNGHISFQVPNGVFVTDNPN